MNYENIGFILDTVGTQDTTKNSTITPLFNEYQAQTSKTTKSNDPFDNFFQEMGYSSEGRKKNRKPIKTFSLKEKPIFDEKQLQNILEKSKVLNPDFEKLQNVPDFNKSDKKLREERRREADKTKGKKWFNMPATEMTEEVKRDLEVLKMRSVLDPKHFYKKNDLKVLPKYFQIGKVEDNALDYYSNRLTRKERKKTLVDELLADAEFQKHNKKKYNEIMVEKQKSHYKAYKQAKRLKRKKK